MIEETMRELIRLFREHVEENTVLSAGSIVEIAKLPVIVLNGPTLTEKKRLMRDPERFTVIDKKAGQAIRKIQLEERGSIYLSSKGRATGILRVGTEDISEAIRLAESKGLLLIDEIPEEEAGS